MKHYFKRVGSRGFAGRIPLGYCNTEEYSISLRLKSPRGSNYPTRAELVELQDRLIKTTESFYQEKGVRLRTKEEIDNAKKMSKLRARALEIADQGSAEQSEASIQPSPESV